MEWVAAAEWRTAESAPPPRAARAVGANSKAHHSGHRVSQTIAAYPTGCVIAIADLVACVWLPDARRNQFATIEQLRQANVDVHALLDHLHAEGPWCWVLRNARPCDAPRPARGMIGLWDWEDSATR